MFSSVPALHASSLRAPYNPIASVLLDIVLVLGSEYDTALVPLARFRGVHLHFQHFACIVFRD